ncbi:MAG: HEAT repeat domain-containing protein [Truepera sp.]|nr:HEAT repeat domain-containing protein [Truepera sp.]
MQRPRVVAVFLSTVIAAVAVMATMGGLVLWFGETLNPVRAWWSLELALGGVAVALAIMAVLHVGLLAGEAFSAAAVRRRAGEWELAWVRGASGEAQPSVRRRDLVAASEAAAAVLRELTGEAAVAVRLALHETGITANDIAVASRVRGSRGWRRAVSVHGGGWPSRRATAALQRLAWQAPAEALPLFLQAATSNELAHARAALLGTCRCLGEAPHESDLVSAVIEVITAHVGMAERAGVARPFLAGVLTNAGDGTLAVCEELLASDLPEPIKAAALDALAIMQPEGAVAVVSSALLEGLTGEALAAALRTLAAIGVAPEECQTVILAATHHEDEGVRVQAAHALASVPPESGLPTLWRLLGDTSFEVRLAAAKAARDSGTKGWQMLLAAIELHPDRFARDSARIASWGDGDPAAAASGTPLSAAATLPAQAQA